MISIVRKYYKKFTRENRNRALDLELLKKSKSLPPEQVKDCMVFPDREKMISSFPKYGVVAEVGVAIGQFSDSILRFNSPKKLYLIDAWAMGNHDKYGIPAYDFILNRFSDEIDSKQIEIKRGWSWNMLKELEDKSLDWIYIDAAHDYDSVQKDLSIAVKKINTGGIIAGHDYTRWGKNGKRFGVLEAVNEFCMSNSFNLIGITIENDYNWSYAIQKPNQK